jgi:uncharacterized SAM-binding protein YcdF (DUF218 family)
LAPFGTLIVALPLIASSRIHQTEFLLPFALLLAVISLVRLWRRSRPRPWMLALSITVLILLSSSLVASFLSMLLEARYEGRHFADTADAIVVLSGGVEPQDVDHPFPVLAQDSYTRCLKGAWLHRSRPQRPILVTGHDCATPMAHLLQSEGIPPSLIWKEDCATTTHENAVYSGAILRSNGIRTVALVTDAKSMLRAELCFRREHISVIPSPVELEVFQLDPWIFIPSWKAIRSNGEALHEIVGLVWYRWRGWI